MEPVHRAQTAPPFSHPLHTSDSAPPLRFVADSAKLPERANILEGAATKQELAHDRGWQAYRASQPENSPVLSPDRNGETRTSDAPLLPLSGLDNGQLDNGRTAGASPFTPPKIAPPGIEPHPAHLPISPAQLSTKRWSSEWIHETVQSRSLPGALLLLTLSTANLDVISFQRYGVFTTAQTGNTILLAYHAVEQSPGPELENAGVSLAFYFLSCTVFGQIGWRVGHRTRWWMIFSLCWQIVLLLILIVLVSPAGPARTQPGADLSWVAIMLAALQGGPQLTMSSSAGVPEIPTAILTGTYASFAREEDLFHLHPKYKDLKLWYIATFWTGCFTGAVVARFSHTWVGFLVAMVCKMMALGWVMFAKGDLQSPKKVDAL